MRVFIIDTSTMEPELQGGLIGVEGSSTPTAAEKQGCVETVSRYVIDGWAVTADPNTPIGWLAALTAETACVPFVNLTRLAPEELTPQAARLSTGPGPGQPTWSEVCRDDGRDGFVRSGRCGFSTSFGFARQNGLGNTTCRYEGIRFGSIPMARFA